MTEEMDEMVQAAVAEVFSMMLNAPIEHLSVAGAAQPIECSVASSVGFLGKVNGVVYLYFEGDLSKQVCGTLLGMSDEELDDPEMVNDTLGEISNMMVGQIKSCLCDRGLECRLTIPSILRGSGLKVDGTSDTTRRLIFFKSYDQRLIVEVLIKSENNSEQTES